MSKPYRTSKDIALSKLQRYCAYQDRCHQEVRNKLLELQIYGDDLEEIIAALILDDFLNEERFARSYARGKFRMKQWGKVKITRELKKRQISAYCIRKAMEEVEEEDYETGLRNLLIKKRKRTTADNEFQLKGKLANYAIRKGFEPELVWKILKSLFS